MDFNTYQRLIKVMIPKEMQGEELRMHTAKGLSNRSEEINTLIEKMKNEEGEYNSETMEQINNKLCDALMWVALLCESHGLKLNDIAMMNLYSIGELLNLRLVGVCETSNSIK